MASLRGFPKSITNDLSIFIFVMGRSFKYVSSRRSKPTTSLGERAWFRFARIWHVTGQSKVRNDQATGLAEASRERVWRRRAEDLVPAGEWLELRWARPAARRCGIERDVLQLLAFCGLAQEQAAAAHVAATDE